MSNDLPEDVNVIINETSRNESFGKLLSEYSSKDQRKLIRRIETLDRRLTNARYAVIFNQECIHLCGFSFFKGEMPQLFVTLQ